MHIEGCRLDDEAHFSVAVAVAVAVVVVDVVIAVGSGSRTAAVSAHEPEAAETYKAIVA